MKTGDLYQIMMSTVCRHTGVGELELIDSKKEECVDARYLLVYFLSQFLTDEEISRQTKIPRQSVNRIRNHFDVKINKWSVKKCLHKADNRLPLNMCNAANIRPFSITPNKKLNILL